MRPESHVAVERRNRAAFLAVFKAGRLSRLLQSEVALFGGAVRPRALRLATALEFGLIDSDLTGRSHERKRVYARFAFAFLARGRLKLSYPEIGRALGGRDHTTAQHARRRAEGLIAIDPDFAARCARIEAALWPAPQPTRLDL